MKKRKILKRGIASLLAVVLAVGLLPVMPDNTLTVKAADGVTPAMTLGTGSIADPAVPASTNDAWTGSYVYFGTYNGNPVKYRVLDSETTVFGGATMLLDCDSILESRRAFDDSSDNNWELSDIRTYLNGEFLTNNFTTAEQNAIAESTKDAADGQDGDEKGYLAYTPLSGDKIFFLDAKEATNTSYGYSNTPEEVENRRKTGGGMCYWWLRSAYRDGNDNGAGCVGSEGDVFYDIVNNSPSGVSPALNINLSSVLFSSAIGTGKSDALSADSSPIGTTTGTEWKLTLRDEGKTIKVTDDRKGTKAAGGTITVPYTYADTATTDAEKVNQISVMITDQAYTEAGAKILYYGALQNIKDTDGNGSTVSDAAIGTGTFVLPDGLKGTLGTDYHVYILAEHVNKSNETDYAGTPAEITTISIENVDVDVDAPVAGASLDTSAAVPSYITDATVTWTADGSEVTDSALYNTVHTVNVTLTAAGGYAFTDAATAAVNTNAAGVTKNENGTLTVTYAFPATEKDRLISITTPASIRVANGTAYASMNLPKEINIQTEGGAAATAPVSWDTTTPASGSYDRKVLTEQTVTLNGVVTCPDSVDANGVTLATTITITIEAAGTTGGSTTAPSGGSTTAPSGGSTTAPAGGSTTAPSGGSTTAPADETDIPDQPEVPDSATESARHVLCLVSSSVMQVIGNLFLPHYFPLRLLVPRLHKIG